MCSSDLMVLQLISSAKKLVDYVILDCGSAMTNVFTPAAIESGDLVLRIVTPDLKGINYLKAHQPLLVDGRFHYHEHMTFAGMARPFHAFDDMGYIIGGFDGLLPYGKEIDRCATEGGMFQAIKYCNSKYTASLNKILETLACSIPRINGSSIGSLTRFQSAWNVILRTTYPSFLLSSVTKTSQFSRL